MNINVLKLWPVIVAARRWGPVWRDAITSIHDKQRQEFLFVLYVVAECVILVEFHILFRFGGQ